MICFTTESGRRAELIHRNIHATMLVTNKSAGKEVKSAYSCFAHCDVGTIQLPEAADLDW
jgi:hypothetical protein